MAANVLDAGLLDTGEHVHAMNPLERGYGVAVEPVHAFTDDHRGHPADFEA
jgi:hypothetical protein